MKDLLFDEFQSTVDEALIRNSSLLDILSRLDEFSARTHRATIKSITQCGCINVNTTTVNLNDEKTLAELKNRGEKILEGDLCPRCREKIEEEMGGMMLYLAALCNSLDINLYDVVLKEYNKAKTLGKYSLF